MDQIIAMALFALTMSISPGPVNFIILSTGLNHSIKAALPFVLGATLGFTLLLFLIGLGLSAIAEQFGWLIDVMTLLGASLIIYLGYKLFTSKGDLDKSQAPIPTLWQGAALQWLNPKAWGACIAAVGLFELDQSRNLLYYFTIQYGLLCFIGIGSWAFFGAQVERFLKTEKQRQIFNQLLGATLILLAAFLLY